MRVVSGILFTLRSSEPFVPSTPHSSPLLLRASPPRRSLSLAIRRSSVAFTKNSDVLRQQDSFNYLGLQIK